MVLTGKEYPKEIADLISACRAVRKWWEIHRFDDSGPLDEFSRFNSDDETVFWKLCNCMDKLDEKGEETKVNDGNFQKQEPEG